MLYSTVAIAALSALQAVQSTAIVKPNYQPQLESLAQHAAHEDGTVSPASNSPNERRELDDPYRLTYEGLGVVDGKLAVIKYKQSPRLHEKFSGSTFEFALGHGGQDGLGTLPKVRVFNKEGKRIGTKDFNKSTFWQIVEALFPWLPFRTDFRKKTHMGYTGTLSVEHDGRGTYATLKGGEHEGDDMCLAWVKVTRPVAWSHAMNSYREDTEFIAGDYGRHCDRQWYYSNMQPDPESEQRTECFWLGGNRDDVLQFRMDSFNPRNLGNNTLPDRFCHGGEFHLRHHAEGDGLSPKAKNVELSKVTLYPWDIIAAKSKALEDADKNQKKKEKKVFKQLVISDLKSQPVKELCEHPSSRGPDFVNTREKLYCEMKTQSIYELCGPTWEGKDCFNMTNYKLAQADEDGKQKKKLKTGDYRQVYDWRY